MRQDNNGKFTKTSNQLAHSGVDFCGPVYIHYKLRGKHHQKAYTAVFVCFATEAVNLEIVSDLMTEAFIGFLKRFIARLGNCKQIYCDNGKCSSILW